MDQYDKTHNAILHLLRIGLGAKEVFCEEPDWDQVYDVASKHGILPIVFDGYIKKYESGEKVPIIPVKTKMQFIASSFSVETSCERQNEVSAYIAGIFAKGGLRTYVLKGNIIAECYPIPKHRYSADLDCFLVTIEGWKNIDAWEQGNNLIEQNGYPVLRDFYKNSTFTLSNLLVENHKFLTPFRGNKRLTKLESLLQRMLQEDEGNDKINNTDLYRPPVMVSALFLIEHSFSHFLHEGLNLRHITDLMMFSRYHKDDINWPMFQQYIDEFGFRQFYDAYCHVGEFVLGERPEGSLTMQERRMMDSVWEGLDLHNTVRGIRGKLNLVGNTFRARWKYSYFSPISMLQALWIQVKGFLFIKHPTLNQ